MRKNMPDEQHLAIEVDRRNHADLVATEVEDVEVADSVRRIEGGLQVCIVRVGPGLDELAPSLERSMRLAMN
jgi:hypothetical protein